MRMRKISEKVPTLDDLIQKFLLVKQSQHTGELAMRDYPNIDYELVLGHYAEIEQWVESGRVDCGFLRLPAHHDFDTFSLAEDPLFAVLPEAHPIAKCDCVPLEALCEEPFLFLEKEEKAEISELFARHKLQPHVQLRTVDDYAVMSMVERARAQYPPGTDPAPDSLQNRHPPARRSGQPDARSCAAQRRAHAACRPLLSGLSPLPELENRLDCQNSRAGDFYAIFRDVRPLPGGS